MVYRRAGRNEFYISCPTRTGRVKRSTGTTNRAIARGMERMVEELGPNGQRAWDLLDRIADNSLSLGELYDAHARNDLAGLRAQLQDVDLEPHVAPWATWLRDRVAPDTAAHYLVHVRTLIPAGKSFGRSQLTAMTIARWLTTRTALVQKRRPTTTGISRRRDDPAPRVLTGSSKRKYLAAVRSFANYLVATGVFATNPVRDVQAPPANRPRVVELELRDVLRIVDGARQPFRGLFALLYGGGVEISAALSCVDADVNVARREVRARGTKSHSRDRVVRVAEWAWPYLEEHLRTVLPGERLFRGIHRWRASDEHGERIRALGLPHHRLHDARHFYAIRAIRAGTPYELVARQLGHATIAMVAKVYGKFLPNSDERDRWERIAADQDRMAMGGMLTQANLARGEKTPVKTPETPTKTPTMGTAMGANVESLLPPNAVTPWGFNSRGGTRTHDPGIMSAVL